MAGGSGLTATAAVVVAPINQPPVANDESAIVGPADGGVAFIDVLANDFDPDGDPLTIIGITQPDPLFGLVEILPDNTIRYTVLEVVPVATFTYTISDGRGGKATALVSVSSP